VIEQLGRVPDVLALPYGGGGNITAYAKGFAEERATLRLIGGQASERSHTIASAIRIAEPAHSHEVEALVAEGRAELVSVRDEEITDAWLELASREGLFCEPSSAAGLAAVLRGDVEGDRIVVTITGHGLKDPAAAELHAPRPTPVAPDPDAIAGAFAGRKR